MKIGFVRRGYSASGGAESYLKRLGQGVCDAGHEAHLITTLAWPPNEWPFGPITHLAGGTPTQFADALETARATLGCDVIMSLERVWQCDVFRAGDGVHRAWLQRRAHYNSALKKFKAIFNRKHRSILRLEESLLCHGGARRVITNSRLIKEEINWLYGFPANEIDLIYNGVPLSEFTNIATDRAKSRAAFGIAPDEIIVLFAGSGWARKGLPFAIAAVEACGIPKMQLLVAGKGNASRYRAHDVKFLGEVQNLPALYAAADIFLLPTIYEPFSNACLEALAAGLPVITTETNGFSEIIEDGRHGSIIPDAADFMSFRDALHFWADANRRAQARPLIQERATQFSIEKNVEATLQILYQAAATATSRNLSS
ncbi:MAG: glycosyltransferase family 4 protein [Verrucomicrobiota bacterium]|nr:glycosyltransferase family 4 protein [Verrucomicrobiota bacterium]